MARRPGWEHEGHSLALFLGEAPGLPCKALLQQATDGGRSTAGAQGVQRQVRKGPARPRGGPVLALHLRQCPSNLGPPREQPMGAQSPSAAAAESQAHPQHEQEASGSMADSNAMKARR